MLDRIRPHIDHGTPDVQVDALTVDAALALREKNYQRARESTEALLRLKLPLQAQANAWFMLARIADKQGVVAEAMHDLEQVQRLEWSCGGTL